MIFKYFFSLFIFIFLLCVAYYANCLPKRKLEDRLKLYVRLNARIPKAFTVAKLQDDPQSSLAMFKNCYVEVDRDGTKNYIRCKEEPFGVTVDGEKIQVKLRKKQFPKH